MNRCSVMVFLSVGHRALFVRFPALMSAENACFSLELLVVLVVALGQIPVTRPANELLGSLFSLFDRGVFNSEMPGIISNS